MFCFVCVGVCVLFCVCVVRWCSSVLCFVVSVFCNCLCRCLCSVGVCVLF